MHDKTSILQGMYAKETTINTNQFYSFQIPERIDIANFLGSFRLYFAYILLNICKNIICI